MNSFTIKDLENISGIKAHTIRIWEQRYTFLKPNRTDTNIRVYSNEELKVLLNIALLNKYGFKISHISKMSPEEIREKIFTLNQSQAQQERIINELIQFMVDLDLQHFEMLLNSYVINKGIEKTITQIIFPFLERIGVLWQTNHINPAQEHLITNIIRQKLIVGIDKTVHPVMRSTSFLLYLPEGEYHEIGLLFISFLLKTKGLNVYYIGCNVPLKDVEYVVKAKQPHYVYTHLTNIHNHPILEKYLNALQVRLPGSKILISGKVIHDYKKKTAPNIQLMYSLHDVMEFIADI